MRKIFGEMKMLVSQIKLCRSTASTMTIQVFMAQKKTGEKKEEKIHIILGKTSQRIFFLGGFHNSSSPLKSHPSFALNFCLSSFFFASSTLLSKIKRSRFCLVAKGFKVMVAMVHQISFEQTKNWQSPSTPSPLYPRI